MDTYQTPLFMLRGFSFALLLSVCAMGLTAPDAQALSVDEMQGILKTIDKRQRSVGDWKALAYVRSKEKGKSDIAREMVIYRRDASDKMMILFLKPRNESGKGYLRLDRNLWMYDPVVGKWERRTERDRIAGTDSRRADFDESRLAAEYAPSYLGEGKLGRFKVHKLKLSSKKGVDVAWPVIELAVDVESGNVLKRQEFALSGRLIRTSYYPKWMKLKSPTGGEDVWYPKEMRFFDEIEKGNSTLVKILGIDLKDLPTNIFTKAWLEAKSR
jgi:hypothetical protein